MPTITVILIALSPGIYAWWSGKRLLKQKDDPLLAERLQAQRSSVFLWVFLSTAALSYLDYPQWALLTVPATLAGVYPSRKALFDESWNFAGYLCFWLRFILAFQGFSLLLGLTPWLIALAGEWRWPALGILALLLFGWLFFGREVFLALLGAKPLPDSTTRTRFRAIAARSPIPAPQLMIVDFQGGRVANAFALPATSHSAVIFTRTLLDELQADEADAILAHELAHLEYQDASFIKRKAALVCVLIVLALAITPLAEKLFGAGILAWWKLLLIGLALIWLLRLAVGHRQHHESEADRRAVELCGNAEALARGLTRLHELSRLPRRWDNTRESAESHPSLANRIRAIYEVEPATGAGLSEPVVLASVHTGRYVILEAERIHWLSGVPEDTLQDPASLRNRAASATALAYSELRELLVKPAAKQGALLCATTRSGQKRQLLLRPEEVAMAQQALDAVDTKLYKQSRQDLQLPLLVILLSLGIMLAGIKSAFLIFIPFGIYCILRPRLYGLAALAMTGLGEVLITLLQRPPLQNSDWIAYATLLALSVTALFCTWYFRTRETAQPGKDSLWLGVLLALLVFTNWFVLAVVMFNAPTLLDLHLIAQSSTSSVTALLALAGLIAIVGRKQVRIWIVGLLCLLATAPLFLQSAYFAEHWAGDPFAVASGPLQWQSLDIKAQRQVPILKYATKLRLSPLASRYAYHGSKNPGYVEVNTTGTFIISDFDGKQTTELQADDLEFVDENRLLLLNLTHKNNTLQLLINNKGSWELKKEWRLQPQIKNAKLDLNRDSGQWRVIGLEVSNTGKAFLAEGKTDQEEALLQEFPPMPDGNYGRFPVSVGANLINITTFNSRHFYYELWLSQGAEWRNIAATAKRIECLSAPPGSSNTTPIPCLASHNRYQIGLFHPQTGKVNPLLNLQSIYGLDRSVQQNGLLYLLSGTNNIVAINIAAQQGATLNIESSGIYVSDVAIAGPWLATLSRTNPDDAQLQLFKLPLEWAAP